MKQLFIFACVVLFNIPVITFGQGCNFTVNAGSDVILCNPSSIQLNAMINGTPSSTPTYQWTPTTGLSNTNIPNPVATVNNTTSYIVEVSTQGNTNLLMVILKVVRLVLQRVLMLDLAEHGDHLLR